MNNYIVAILLIFSFNLSLGQQLQLSLEDVIDLARSQSTSAKWAETRKENFYWRYRNFRADYNPFLNLSGEIPGFYRGITGIQQPDGTIQFRKQELINSNLNLGLVQPLAFSGGEISINSRLGQVRNLQEGETEWNSTWYYVQLDQPVFGFNSLKWNKQIEPLRYEESKRSYVEEMEAISEEATSRFFNFLDAQINLQIAELNLANNDTIYRIEQGRYNIGTTSKDHLLQVELQLLRSQQAVAQANLDLQVARQELRSYIGFRETGNADLILLLPQELPQFDIALDTALYYAQKNRAAFVEFERRRIEAERDLAQARAQRFSTNLVASFGLNNSAQTVENAYINPDQQQRVNLSLNVPILDWGRGKSRVKVAIANQQLTQYTLEQDIRNFEQEIMTIVSMFDVMRRQIAITRKSDEVAQERYEVAQNRYLIGKTDITNLNIALDEKDNAKRSYISSLRDFWTSYFSLRRLTLYDFVNDELLYQLEE